MATRIMFPVGRLVGGSVEKMHPRTEADGKTPKLGTDGKPLMSINFGVAIPKTQADWRNESYVHPTMGRIEWGRQIFELAKAAYPTLHLTPTFAYKIIDGDSAIPNKNGKIPRDQTGYAGHWVIWFSQGWMPKLVNADGTCELAEGSILPGYYVQVCGDVASNGAQPPNTPGLYMNPVAVALVGIGERIETSVDTKTLGFGGAALPPGAQPVPNVVEGASFGAPAAPTPPAAAPAPTPVQPNAAFMTPPPPAAPPVAPAGPVMTPKAGGASYEAFRAQGWNDEQLRANGYML